MYSIQTIIRTAVITLASLSTLFSAQPLRAEIKALLPDKPICYMYAASQKVDPDTGEESEVPNIGIQGQGAYDYFNANFVNGSETGFFAPSYRISEINPKETRCIWVHVDRQKLDEGWRHLPEEFSNAAFITALHNYMLEGGNIYFSGQAVELLGPIWRIVPSLQINFFNYEDAYQFNRDTWGIKPLWNDGSTFRTAETPQEHPIFDGLTPIPDKDAFGMLSGESFVRDNHNSLWDLTHLSFTYGSEGEEGAGRQLSNRQRFEHDNLASVLASFEWDAEPYFAGLVEFHPVYSWDYDKHSYSKQSGSIICNGIAAMQWRYFNEGNYDINTPDTWFDNHELLSSANACRANLEKLTGNILNYLSGSPIVIPDTHPYVLPSSDKVEEIIESTGLIAMYIGYDDEEALMNSNNDQEIMAYRYFTEAFVNSDFQNRYGQRGPKVLWKGDKDKIVFCGQENTGDDAEGYECVWINIAGTRAKKIYEIVDENGNPLKDENGEPLTSTNYSFTSEDLLKVFDDQESFDYLVSQLRKFRADGGNLYFTKFANIMVNDVDPSILDPTQVTADMKEESDPWGINVNHSGYDQSKHPIFSTMKLTDRTHGQGVTLFTGSGERLDNNCVWWLDDAHCAPYGSTGWDGLSAADRIKRFNRENNATILGVWGHNEDYAFYTAALVEFHPNRNPVVNDPAPSADSPARVTPRPTVQLRRGTMIANGPGCYEWDTVDNDKDDDENVRQLTNNILAYLTPVMTEPTYTGIGLTDKESEQQNADGDSPVYYDLFGNRLERPVKGVCIEVSGSKTRKIIL